AGHGPPGRNGFLHAGHATFRVRMYMCSCFTATCSPQGGHTFTTGIRLSCVSVARFTMPKRDALLPDRRIMWNGWPCIACLVPIHAPPTRSRSTDGQERCRPLWRWEDGENHYCQASVIPPLRQGSYA